MAITEQFAGLDMGQLIGGPLNATADASISLARSTANFINEVGFDKSGKIRTAAFGFSRNSTNDDGTSNLESLNVDVPLLAIVPIPNLQIDEVNVIFDMEVKESEKSEKALDLGASLSGSAKFGPVKVNITGSVSAHESNTRSSDNSAKYHVDVRATNHGTPEGLARVLDMIAAGISPSLVDSQLRDANGQALPEASKAKAEKLRALRTEISDLENRRNAAQRLLDDSIIRLRTIAREQLNVYDVKATDSLQADNANEDKISSLIGTVDSCWNTYMNNISAKIELLADSDKSGADAIKILSLKAFKEDMEEAPEYSTGESKYDALLQAQDTALESCRNLKAIDNNLINKRTDYNNAISQPAGTSAA